MKPVARQGSSFATDLLGTSLAQGVTALLNIAALAVISRRMGEFQLGYYTLERRSMSLIQPAAVLGMYVATARYVALAVGRRSGYETRYALTAGAIVVAASSIVAAVLLEFRPEFASLFFGDPHQTALVSALAGFVVAMALYGLVYAVYRGALSVYPANALELLVVGLLPLVLALAAFKSFVAYMWSLNAVIAVVTAIWAVAALRGHARLSSLGASWRATAAQLLRYGLPRVPGDFAVIALFAAPPIVAVHLSGPKAAGYTSVVLSSISLVALAAAPFSMLLLPRVAQELGRGGLDSSPYALLMQATIDCGIGAAALMIVASPILIRLWFPAGPSEVVTAEQVVALGLPGYLFYLIFRSYLDALDRRPLSSVATLTGCATLAVVLPLALSSGDVSTPVAAATATSAAGTAMGLATLMLMRKRITAIGSVRSYALPVVTAAAVGLVGLWTRDASSVAVAATFLAAVVAYGLVLWRMRRSWVDVGATHLAAWRSAR